MKHGHVSGHKRERPPRRQWWAAAEEAACQAVEAHWAVPDRTEATVALVHEALAHEEATMALAGQPHEED